jgi:hypothetical protein
LMMLRWWYAMKEYILLGLMKSWVLRRFRAFEAQ